MGLEVLVPLIMGALLQVAARTGEGVLGAVEDASKDAANLIFARIKEWWSSDNAASSDLERFNSEPGVYQNVIEARLVRKLAASPEMQLQLGDMLSRSGPQIAVFQSIANARGVTGARVEEMTRGVLNVDQRIVEATDVTGVEIKRFR